MYGLTRGTMTLLGVAGAAAVLWLASQFDTDSAGEYWTWVGLLAAAGFVLALSQLLGGWTKWGWPRFSGSVFLLGFLPALVASVLVLLHAQPDSDDFGADWADDLGLDDLADDLTSVLPAIAFGLGLLFGFCFDTTGPRVREVAVERDDAGDGRAATVAPVAVAERERGAEEWERAPARDDRAATDVADARDPAPETTELRPTPEPHVERQEDTAAEPRPDPDAPPPRDEPRSTG